VWGVGELMDPRGASISANRLLMSAFMRSPKRITLIIAYFEFPTALASAAARDGAAYRPAGRVDGARPRRPRPDAGTAGAGAA
jgi:hypothetical protein